MTEPNWRTSSFSGGDGSCVAVAHHGSRVLVRNSNHPTAGTLALAPAVATSWIAGVRGGDWDDLAVQRPRQAPAASSRVASGSSAAMSSSSSPGSRRS